jgi:two-component system NtrC family sensor kinase
MTETVIRGIIHIIPIPICMKKIVCLLLVICFAQWQSIYAQIQEIDSLKHLLRIEKQDSSRCLLLEQLGYLYQESRPDSALVFADYGMDLARRTNYLKGEVKCLSRIGTIYSITGNGAKGLELMLQSLKMSEKLNDPEIRTNILRLIGDVYSDLGDMRKSLDYSLMSRKMASLLNLNQMVAVCSIGIGDSYEKIDLLDSAEFYTKQGYELAVKNNYPDLMGVALNNLGNI